MKRIAIIGGGSWGTGLSIVLSRARVPHTIVLWVYEPEIADSIRLRRVNEVFLPGLEVPLEVRVTTDLGEAVREADVVLGVMPSAHARGLYARIAAFARPRVLFVSATKGLEHPTLLRMTQVIRESLPAALAPRIAALSGPSFAREVARGDPTAIVVASEDAGAAAEAQEEFSGPTFRLYTHSDVTGVEIGGSVKNVIAIAAGVAQGLGFGHNTLAALITRGLAEIMRLGAALGARPETLAGLAGMGDLVLTCTGDLSRNRTVGVELGRGRSLAEILGTMRMVAEGVGTTEATHALAHRLGVEMPITEQMYAVLNQGRSPREAIRLLMDRPLRHE
jgi:glycerol-3-phosphate dehydrogenase (NAD(P)+)